MKQCKNQVTWALSYVYSEVTKFGRELLKQQTRYPCQQVVALTLHHPEVMLAS